MDNGQNKPKENKGAGPVGHVANGDPGDRGVLNEDASNTRDGKADQHQYADEMLQQQNNDEEDQFDLNTLKGNVPNDRKGEADNDQK